MLLCLSTTGRTEDYLSQSDEIIDLMREVAPLRAQLAAAESERDRLAARIVEIGDQSAAANARYERGLSSLQAERDRLAAALSFYADLNNWRVTVSAGNEAFTATDMDVGAKARAALTPPAAIGAPVSHRDPVVLADDKGKEPSRG